MHRKLNISICVITVLLILSVTGAQKNDSDDSGEDLITAVQVGSSDQRSLLTESEKLQNSPSAKFHPGVFFSKFTKESAVKAFSQKTKLMVQKGFKNKRSQTIFLVLIVFTAGVLISVRYFRMKGKDNRFMTTTRLSVMNRFVRQACRYIEKNYADVDLTVDQICSDLVTGKAYLEALFKKELGMRVEDFIDQVRINRVKIMINKNPGLSLSEAAKGSGFADEKECLSRFRSICGVDFEAYRDKHFQSGEL